MSVNQYLKELSKPFDVNSVKWRLQQANKEKTGGWAVPYLDSRAIANRLDEVVGQMRWKDEYKPWISSKEGGTSQLCVIYIYDDDLKEWISKTDGAGLSAIEPIKGGISDAFKRAAVKWGIGRYLYGMEPVWVKAKAKGNSAIIEKEEMPRLKQYYISYLKQLNSAGDTPVQKQPTKQNQKPKAETSAGKQSAVVPLYEILGVKTQQGNNGVRSMLRIKDLNAENKVATVYYNGDDKNLKTGAKLERAVFSAKDTEYGKIHILQDYDMAA